MDEKEAEARPVMGTIFLVFIPCSWLEHLSALNCKGVRQYPGQHTMHSLSKKYYWMATQHSQHYCHS